MGCDIHMYAEVRVDIPAQSLKEACKRVIQRFHPVNMDKISLPIELQEYLQIPSPDHKWVCVPEEVMKKKESGEYTAVEEWLEVFDDRDYDLFGWLADVRNYADVPVLGCEEGLPYDVSDYVNMECEEWYE